MNLLYLANIRLPTEKAHGIQIVKTAEALAEAGASVELMVPTRGNKIKQDPLAYYGVRGLFTLTILRVPDWVRFGVLGFAVSAVLFSLKARASVSFRKAGIVYSRDALVLIPLLFTGKRLVFEAHAKPSLPARLVARRAFRTVVISRGLRDAYRAIGVEDSRIVVAPDAVDAGWFRGVPGREQARRELGLPDGPLALYAGHLYPRKGAHVLARAARHLPGVEVVFVGGAGEEAESFRRRWGSEKNIRVLGHVNHERIPLYLRAADALILPNSGASEDSSRFTSPMKLFEYMASGTPIVASDVPAIREVLDDRSAFFVRPDDAGALSEGVRAALSEEASRRAEAALALVDSYTWQARASGILEALREER